jgi:hypothetical protein
VATNDPTTAHFTAIKTWETQVSRTNQGTRTPTYTQTLEAREKKPRHQTMDKVQKYNSFKTSVLHSLSHSCVVKNNHFREKHFSQMPWVSKGHEEAYLRMRYGSFTNPIKQAE